ncbi:hypothetical protein [Pseudonocardia sp. GCM10023141]|uniref:hypothetical protein n=1 Tax=Pseudonocardia sp. GCM10023141 TaxID=3252653 RepID=UPI0036062826
MDGPGKAGIRFNAIAVADVEAVIEAAAAHDPSTTGAPDDWAIPSEPADRVSTVTYKRRPLIPAASPRVR